MRRPGPGAPAWVAAETLGAAIASVVGLLFVARLIGPAAAGMGAIAVSAFLLVDVPLSALFGDALLRQADPEERHRNSALWTTVFAAALGATGLALAAPLLAAATGLPPVTDMLRVLALLLPVSAVSGLLAALALRGRQYRLLAARVLLGQPVAVLVGVGAALAGAGAWAMVAQQAAATLAVALLLVLTAGWRPRALVDRAALRALWPVALPQMLSVMVFSGRYRVFLLALGALVAETVVAVAHVAFRLLDVAMAAVTGATARLAMPRLAALQRDPRALAEAYGDLAQLQAMVGLPVAVGLAITAPELVRVLMGPAWAAAAEPARVVALAAIPGFLVGPAAAYWLAVGRTRVNLGLQSLALVVPLLALLVLRPDGPAGAALAWAAGSLVLPPVQLALTLRALGRSPAWLARRLALPVMAAAGMAAVALAVAAELRGQGALIGLAATAAAGAGTYLLLLAAALRFHWPRALREA